MKKYFLIGLMATGIFLGFGARAIAEDVLGCPLGLKKGEFWIKTGLKYSDMKERYNRSENDMVDLESGEHNRVYSSGPRLGYGITDRLNVGILTPYKWVDKKIKKKTPQGVKWMDIDDDGVESLWLAGHYKFFYGEDIAGIFDDMHVGIGAGFKFPLSERDEIKHGIGNGANEAKVGLLYHDHIGRFAFCNHFLYHWRGEAKGISGWKFSDQDLSDRLNYKLSLEFDALGNELWELHLGLFGWFDIENVELAGNFQNKGLDGKKAYNHAVVAGLEFKPYGDEYEHRKLVLNFRIPYSERCPYVPDYTLIAMAMWTF